MKRTNRFKDAFGQLLQGVASAEDHPIGVINGEGNEERDFGSIAFNGFSYRLVGAQKADGLYPFSLCKYDAHGKCVTQMRVELEMADLMVELFLRARSNGEGPCV